MILYSILVLIVGFSQLEASSVPLLRINEVFVNSHPPLVDWIEILNNGAKTIDLGGSVLTTRIDGPRFTFPRDNNDFKIPPKTYLVITSNVWGKNLSLTSFTNYTHDENWPQEFRLSFQPWNSLLNKTSKGTVYQWRTKLTQTNMPFGFYTVMGDGPSIPFVLLNSPTPGADNAYPVVPEVVISQFDFYHFAIEPSSPSNPVTLRNWWYSTGDWGKILSGDVGSYLPPTQFPDILLTNKTYFAPSYTKDEFLCLYNLDHSVGFYGRIASINSSVWDAFDQFGYIGAILIWNANAPAYSEELRTDSQPCLQGCVYIRLSTTSFGLNPNVWEQRSVSTFDYYCETWNGYCVSDCTTVAPDLYTYPLCRTVYYDYSFDYVDYCDCYCDANDIVEDEGLKDCSECVAIDSCTIDDCKQTCVYVIDTSNPLCVPSLTLDPALPNTTSLASYQVAAHKDINPSFPITNMVIIGASSGGAIAAIVILALLIIYGYSCYIRLSAVRSLPPAIKVHFEDAITGFFYKRVEKYVLAKELAKSGTERDRFNDIFYIKLKGDKLQVKTVYAVCPEKLLQGFSIYRNNIISRLQDNRKLFQKDNWKKKDPDGRRAWIRNIFENKIAQLNDINDLAPVLIAVHGTSMEIAWKICQNGFTAIPSDHDAGWYGKGIYFTTCCMYCLSYLKPPSPALIIACLMPGNPYPVTENKSDEVNFYGAALVPGYQSHYVLTNRKGATCHKIVEDDFYDEIVIEQENQVVPMYIVEIGTDNFSQLIRDWNPVQQQPLENTERSISEKSEKRKMSETDDVEYRLYDKKSSSVIML